MTGPGNVRGEDCTAPPDQPRTLAPLRAGQGVGLWVGALSGACAMALAWRVLWVVAMASVLHGRQAHSSLQGAGEGADFSQAGGHFVQALFVAGLSSGVFGGMVAAVVARPAAKLGAVITGALAALILTAACALTYQLWQTPLVGAAARLVLGPLALCGGLGGWLGSFVAGGFRNTGSTPGLDRG